MALTYKNIRIKKRGGGSRLQRVQVLASGKYKFVKNLTKSSSKSTSKKSKSKGKGGKVGKKNSGGIKVPILMIAGVGGAFTAKTPTGRTLIKDIQDGNIENFIYDAKEIFLGIDANGKFQPDFARRGIVPLVAGVVGHILASKLGINRALSQAQRGWPVKINL